MINWSTCSAVERDTVTTDTNLKYQQNLGSRTIAIVVLGTTAWPRFKAGAQLVADALDAATPGAYAEVGVP